MSLNQQFFRKEARELAWYWVAAVAVLLLLFSQPIEISLARNAQNTNGFGGFFEGILWFIGYTLLHAAVTLPFTSEFANKTFARLLAHPVPRMHIWYRKISLVGGFVGLLLFIVAIRAHLVRAACHEADMEPQVLIKYQVIALFIVWSFFSGPFFGLSLRQGLTALLASMISPFTVIIAGVILDAIWDNAFHYHLYERGGQFCDVPVVWIVLGLATCAIAHLSARHFFARLEV
jgi:hypothetical protein